MEIDLMAKSPSKSLTLDEIVQHIDGSSFEEIAEIKKAASEKMDSLKYMVRDQLKADLQAKLSLYGFSLSELGMGNGNPAKGPRKGAGGQRQSKGGPCKVCEFETSVPHDARAHRSQGEDKRPFTDDELAEKGWTRVS